MKQINDENIDEIRNDVNHPEGEDRNGQNQTII